MALTHVSGGVKMVLFVVLATSMWLFVGWLGGWHTVYDSVYAAVIAFVESMRGWLRS